MVAGALLGLVSALPGCGADHAQRDPVEAPAEHELASQDGDEGAEPSNETLDPDGDGIVDALDSCPDEHEDFDGYKDDDGCPDDDVDGDGIADTADKCPLEQEIINGVDDDDGCPDETPLVAIYGSPGIAVHERFFFESDDSTLQAEAQSMCNWVAEVLTEHPDLSLHLRGHADPTEDDLEALSEARAEAVKTCLTDHGIEPERLTTAGYGDTEPVDDNATQDGRATNRRVEFDVLEGP